jgi:cysteinyl-tRNA synthetase
VALKLYNTLTRRKEEFRPVNPPQVKFYVCGPTVYDYIHLGNARVFIVFDVIRRYLQHRGYRVMLVQNYTDIDDKMIQRAAEQGFTVPELAERFIDAYEADVRALKVKPADIQPRATGHIPQIIALIGRLVEKRAAYPSGGDVYFDTAGYENYGALSHQKREELLAGARVDPGEKKRNPLDFVLWKQKKPGEPAWDSPWGAGRPGWHIECSAMAMHYLSETIDLHAGGADLIFPHHENEIAQSTAATGSPFARYWLHAGYLNIDDAKMSKSLGNVLTVRELVKEHHPLDLRFLILSAHYRSPLNFNSELVEASRSGRQRLQEMVDNLNRALPGAGAASAAAESRLQAALEQARFRFTEAMDDDFNTAGAVAVLFELGRDCNIYLKEGYPYQRGLLEKAIGFYREANKILDILEMENPGELEHDIREAIARREKARCRKDWTEADRIRDALLARGVILEDTPYGTRWKKKA